MSGAKSNARTVWRRSAACAASSCQIPASLHETGPDGLRGGVLFQKIGRTRLHRFNDHPEVAEGGHDENAHPGELLFDAGKELQAVHAGHAHVQQGEVHAMPREQGKGLGGVACLEELETFRLEEPAE